MSDTKEGNHLHYWCPTCKELLTVDVKGPIICGSPVCAKCNCQVWKKSEEWVEQEKKCGRIKDEQ